MKKLLLLTLVLSTSVASAVDYYVNPTTGNDANDGLSAETAWQSASRLNASLADGTIAGATWPWTYANGGAVSQTIASNDLLTGVKSGEIVFGAGDTVYLDTSGGPWAIDEGILVSKSGVRISSPTTAFITLFKAVASGSWTPSPGLTGVYQSADTQVNSVLWENHTWLNHPNGANLAAVSSSLVSTAGSFWTDGTTMYLHPFGGTDPRSDGKLFERSRFVPNSHIVGLFNASNCVVENLNIGGTACVRKTDGQPEMDGGNQNGKGYAIYAECNRQFVRNCTATYTGKHGIGIIGGLAGKWSLVQDCQSEQGSPYAGPGGQTPFVVFGAPSPVAHFVRCTTLKDSGLIGSEAGQSKYTSIPAFYGHGLSGTIDVRFIDSIFPGGLIGGEIGITMVNTRCRAFNAYGNSTADRCYFDGEGPVANSGATLTVTNSIWKPAQTLNTALFNRGTVVLDGVTIDGTSCAANAPYNGMFSPQGTTGWRVAIRNSIYICPSGVNLALVGTSGPLFATSGDGSVTLSHNDYLLGPGGYLLHYENNFAGAYYKTAAEAISLGFDTGSAIGDPLLTSYRPGDGSPALSLALSPTTSHDYTGLIQLRTTSGAYEAAGPENTLGPR